MKIAMSLFALVAMLSLTLSVKAQDATTKPAGAAIRGRVQSVDGMVITIKNKNGEVTVTTDANTTFTLDGKPATLADVQKGERLAATPADGVASEVKLTSARKKKAPTTDPAPTAN